jgi:NAD(P)H-dependent flavin oxidoreductase YrpB (nitropropane dioxygenase family)
MRHRILARKHPEAGAQHQGRGSADGNCAVVIEAGAANSMAHRALQRWSRSSWDEFGPVLNAGAWSCGMVAGLIDDIPTAKELIDRIMADAERLIRDRLIGLLGHDQMPASEAA